MKSIVGITAPTTSRVKSQDVNAAPSMIGRPSSDRTLTALGLTTSFFTDTALEDNLIKIIDLDEARRSM